MKNVDFSKYILIRLFNYKFILVNIDYFNKLVLTFKGGSSNGCGKGGKKGVQNLHGIELAFDHCCIC
jgi:hypothetical protein